MSLAYHCDCCGKSMLYNYQHGEYRVDHEGTIITVSLHNHGLTDVCLTCLIDALKNLKATMP